MGDRTSNQSEYSFVHFDTDLDLPGRDCHVFRVGGRSDIRALCRQHHLDKEAVDVLVVVLVGAFLGDGGIRLPCVCGGSQRRFEYRSWKCRVETTESCPDEDARGTIQRYPSTTKNSAGWCPFGTMPWGAAMANHTLCPSQAMPQENPVHSRSTAMRMRQQICVTHPD
eukprot:scaffold37308_cov49-Attheya_sp.AAC.3